MKDTEEHKLEFIRDYPVTLARLWRAVTEPVQLVQWFGPEGVYLDACTLDFSRPGPWSCHMVGKESGNSFIVSGEVTSVAPPDSGAGHIGLTWAWHDPEGKRGPESHVMFTVETTQTGARLTLTHRDLRDIETAQDHSRGWTSTLRKLDVFIGV